MMPLTVTACLLPTPLALLAITSQVCPNQIFPDQVCPATFAPAQVCPDPNLPEAKFA